MIDIETLTTTQIHALTVAHRRIWALSRARVAALTSGPEVTHQHQPATLEEWTDIYCAIARVCEK